MGGLWLVIGANGLLAELPPVSKTAAEATVLPVSATNVPALVATAVAQGGLPQIDRSKWDMACSRLLAALDQNGWRRKDTAQFLGISRKVL